MHSKQYFVLQKLLDLSVDFNRKMKTLGLVQITSVFSSFFTYQFYRSSSVQGITIIRILVFPDCSGSINAVASLFNFFFIIHLFQQVRHSQRNLILNCFNVTGVIYQLSGAVEKSDITAKRKCSIICKVKPYYYFNIQFAIRLPN